METKDIIQKLEMSSLAFREVERELPAYEGISKQLSIAADRLSEQQQVIEELVRDMNVIRERLEGAFGAGVWDLPSPNPNGSSRIDHQNAALFSIIETSRSALSRAKEAGK